jgi:hypothetical protein
MPVKKKAAYRPWWASPVTWLLLFGVWGSAIFGYWSYTHGKVSRPGFPCNEGGWERGEIKGGIMGALALLESAREIEIER